MKYSFITMIITVFKETEFHWTLIDTTFASGTVIILLFKNKN